VTTAARRRATDRGLDVVLERYKDRVNAALIERMDTAKDLPYEARTAMKYSLATGGKRLRPAIVMLACQSIGGTVEQALPAAMTTELLHTATLLYDDIIDGDDMRRGQPAVHVKFGQELAIIIAGLLTTQAFLAIVQLPRLNAHLVHAMNEMGIGAVLELRGDAKGVKGYLAVAGRKTARLFQLAGELGAYAGRATPAQMTALRDYARNLGVAFQLRDDVLDVIGDEKVLGKPVGSDMRNGRPSIVSILLCEELNLTLQELACRVGKTFPPPRLRQPFQRAVEQANTMCHAYVAQAKAALRTLPASSHRETMQELLEFVATRTQ
jgi:geranylgeranyl diphosphate synthase type I